MRAFIPFAVLAFAGSASAQFALLTSRLDLPTGVGRMSTKALPDGNFLMSMAPSGTGLGRLYWMRPGGAIYKTAVVKGSSATGADYVHGGVAIDATGNAYSYGHESVGTFSNDDLVLYRFDSVGNQVWRRTADPTMTARSEVAYDGEVDAFGNLLVFGAAMNGAFTSHEPYVARFRPNGTISMLSHFGAGASNAHDGIDMALSPDGDIHIATDNETSGWYWQINSSGTVTVDEREQINFHPKAIAANNSRAVLAGTLDSEDGLLASWRSLNSFGFLTLDSTHIPSGTPPFAGESAFTTVALDGSGNILAMGNVKDPSNPNMQLRFEKFSPAGSPLTTFNGGSHGRDYLAGDIAIDAWNRFWLTSSLRASATDQSVLIEQYAPAGTRLGYRLYDSPVDGRVPQGLGLHPKNGDVIFGFTRNTGSRAQALVFRSAPAAVGETFGPANVPIWNSTVSLFNNDRYLAGATLHLHTAATKGVVTLNPSNGYFTYRRNPGASGTDTFRYRLEKSGLPSSIATVTLHLAP